MKNIFILMAMSLLFVSNISMAQTSSTSNDIELNTIITKGGWESYMDNGFIRVKKNGYNYGIIKTDGQWIVKPEIVSDSTRVSIEILNLFDGYIPCENLLVYERGVKKGSEDEGAVMRVKLITMSGNVLYDKTYSTESDNERIEKETLLTAINYLLNSNFNSQNLPINEDFKIIYTEQHPNLLKDGYLIFSNRDRGTGNKVYNMIDRTSKITIKNKEDIFYYGSDVFYVRDLNQNNGYFIKVK